MAPDIGWSMPLGNIRVISAAASISSVHQHDLVMGILWRL